MKINALNWPSSGRRQTSCKNNIALLAPVAMVKRLPVICGGTWLCSLLSLTSAPVHAAQSVSAPLSAETTRLLEYDSRLGLLKLARRFPLHSFLVLVAPFGSRSRWTRFNRWEGDFRTTPPQAEHSEGTKGERPDLFFQKMELHSPVQCDRHLFHFCFALPCNDGRLAMLKKIKDQKSSSVEVQSHSGPTGMWKEVTERLTDGCSSARLLSLPLLSSHTLMFLSFFCASSKDFVNVLFDRDLKFSKAQRLFGDFVNLGKKNISHISSRFVFWVHAVKKKLHLVVKI